MDIYVYSFGLAIVIGLIWLALRAYKNTGTLEAENEGKQLTLDIIEYNKKVVWRNEKYINSLTDVERAKLREEYTRK